jgi:hypothetical protein
MATNPTFEPVFAKYGAPMGRHAGPTPSSSGEKWTLQRVRLDRGGYDPGGAYWGIGQPLYWANDGADDAYFRARDRAAAKAYVRANFDPDARFYR